MGRVERLRASRSWRSRLGRGDPSFLRRLALQEANALVHNSPFEGSVRVSPTDLKTDPRCAWIRM
jgi:hypothetical protein